LHLAKDVDHEEFRKKLNEALPDDVTVFCVLEVSQRFDAKISASHREYSYYLPTFMMKSINELFLGTGNPPEVKPNEDIQIIEEEKKEIDVVKESGGIKIMRKNSNDSDEIGDRERYAQDFYLVKSLGHLSEKIFD
jgi:tRNA U38,U39,U40 pseudouridine synthase TruA